MASLETWITLAVSLLISLLGLSGWVHSTFERRDDAKEFRDSIDNRLERIENKIDFFISRSKK